MVSSCRSLSLRPRNRRRRDMATPCSGPYPRSELLWPFEGCIFRESGTHWENLRLSSSAFPADCGCAEHRICGVERRPANPPRPDPRTSSFPRYISWSSPVLSENCEHSCRFLDIVQFPGLGDELGLKMER